MIIWSNCQMAHQVEGFNACLWSSDNSWGRKLRSWHGGSQLLYGTLRLARLWVMIDRYLRRRGFLPIDMKAMILLIVLGQRQQIWIPSTVSLGWSQLYIQGQKLTQSLSRCCCHVGHGWDVRGYDGKFHGKFACEYIGEQKRSGAVIWYVGCLFRCRRDWWGSGWGEVTCV